MNQFTTLAKQIADEIGKPERRTFIERQLLAKSFAANRAAIKAAREEETAARRAERWEYIRSLGTGTLRLTSTAPAEPTNPNAPDDPVFGPNSHTYWGR